MKLKGTSHRYGDNVDTDVIIPARYLNTYDPAELASHCMEGIDPGFASAVKPGDLIIGGKNFGCGSSREHAPIAILGSGVGCVIAAGFARIFFRNAINTGLPILECPEAAAGIGGGDEVEVDLATGTITDLTTGRSFAAKPFPAFILEIIRAGGLVAYLKKKGAETGEEA